MNAATELDLGPLTWVKSEIDQALQRAEAALAQYEASADSTQLKFCRTHVHQVHGALAMVGLEGVTLLSESAEALLLGMEDERLPSGDMSIAALRQALAALGQYLDDLMLGEPNQPLRLLPACQALAVVRGLPELHPGELFFPDLSLRPPKRTEAVPELSAEQMLNALKAERMHFQKGLLSWLKKPEESEMARHVMRDAVAAIEAAQPSPAARAFWWVSLAFLDALVDPELNADPAARQLCSRIDAQIRRLLGGASNFAERVMREALYYVAKVPTETSPIVAQVQATYGLPEMMPGAAASIVALPHEAELRKLRDTLVATEEHWNKFCTGTAGSLDGFVGYARICAQLTAEIGQTDFKRLGQGLGTVANWLAEDASRFGENVAMEVATTILLLQNAQENFTHLGTDFAQQVDLMVARLHACIAGRPATDEALPLLDEMTRRAQERLLIAQVGKEIQSNLGQIEQSLDTFFRNPQKAHDLLQLDTPIKQVSGALAMLGHFGAVNSLKECAARIRQFSEPDYQASSDDFEALAQQLSMLGFFVDALQNGETDFDAFVRRIRGEKPVDRDESEIESPVAPTVESQLAEQARETQALIEAVRAAPDDLQLRESLKQNLLAIQKDADLVSNRGLGESAKAVLQALQSGASVDSVLADLMPAKAESNQTSAETLQLADAPHDAIDAELLGIFLEEANEVLGSIGEQKALLQANPNNIDALTTIRRSTHTLKGSGRMVGLNDLGETAWELEQTLNLWLRQDQPATPELSTMIDEAHGVFTNWVACLESGLGAAPDTTALVAQARRLRGVETESPVVPVELPAEPVTPVEALPTEIEFSIDLPNVADEVPALETEEVPSYLVEKPVEEAIVEQVIEPVVEPAYATALPESQVDDLTVVSAEVVAPLADEIPPEMPEVIEPAEQPAELPPMVTASPTLYDIFRDEARGYLQTLVDSYAVLDADPSGPTTFEMTRAAHTLGGIAATVGLLPLHHLAIALEHALLRRDSSANPQSIGGLETVRQAIITLEGMFAALARQEAPEEQAQLIAALEDIFHAAPEVEPPVETESGGVAELPQAPAEPLAEQPAAAPAIPLLTDELDEQLLPIFLEEAADLTRDLTSHLRAWRSEMVGDVIPHAIARVLHTFKGSARMAGAMNLGEATHLLEARVEEAVRAAEATPAFIDEIEAGCDGLIQAVERLRAGPETTVPPETVARNEAAPVVAAAIEVEPDPEAGSQRATLRVRADLVDRLVNEAGELSIARARIEGEMRSLKGSLLDLTENVIRLRRQLREIEIQAESQIQARVAQSPDADALFDPLELDRFTRFQELTRFMAESVNDVATVQQNLLKNLDDANAAILAQARLNRSLQQELMGVRMLPFASQTERLYRVVRQTAKETGKRATLDIVGGQVDIDRSVLDKMLAPIEHMLRNAMAHGIEERSERLSAGKREAGEIVLRLTQEGNEIIIALSDDGKGLDTTKIRARAEALGWLQPGQPISDAALFDFIFEPGFSTAAELTQLAGRGVGMDVVKTAVSELGGRIEIVSIAGQGATFRLYLPLTLAVTQTLLVRVGAHLYAVPSTMIEQVMEMKEKGLDGIREAAAVEWQGNRYPFHFLPHLLGDLTAVPEAHRQYWVLLLRSGAQRVAVLVDELKGNQEVVVKNIGAQLSRVVGIAGATVLGDGHVVLILNPVALSSRVASSSIHTAVPTMIPPMMLKSGRLPTVMVVDDSLTVRKITSRLLMREGYQVLVAKDGVDALEQLIDELPDVILSDIEMPRMDGFDLLRNLRSDERLRSVPVIMITSRTADKHRNYALEIGANHYLGKPYDEIELLGLVAGYCKKA